MTILKTQSTARRRPWHTLSALVLLMLLLGAGNAYAITRDSVLARAQRWIDLSVPYSQSRYYGGYRTDCSGFASMAWQTGSSWTTRSLYKVSRPIAAADLRPGDAMLKAGYHVRVFYGWADPAHTAYVTYEQTGPTTKSSIKSLGIDLAYGYVPYRYKKIADGPPPWNAVANPTFDVWASGAPVWWELPAERPATAGYGDRDAYGHASVIKVGTSALGLGNPSSRPKDVVEVSQIAPVTAGVPYTLSLMAGTTGDPAGLELGLRFMDAAGSALATTAITGNACGIDTTTLKRMSLTLTAPPGAVAASIGVRLRGGVDATGSIGTTATLDDARLYDNTPATMSSALSKASVTRRHSLTLRGRVTAPIAAGTVRIYVIRPHKTKPSFLADRPLVAGAWSMMVKPTMRGKYTFIVAYLGYGPYGPITSGRMSLRVK